MLEVMPSDGKRFRSQLEGERPILPLEICKLTAPSEAMKKDHKIRRCFQIYPQDRMTKLIKFKEDLERYMYILNLQLSLLHP